MMKGQFTVLIPVKIINKYSQTQILMMMNGQFINTNKSYIEQKRERKRRQRLPCKQAKGPATEVAVYTRYVHILIMEI